MKKSAILFLLVLSGILSGMASIANLESKLKSVTAPQEKLEILLELALVYKDSQPELTIKHAGQALDLARQVKNKESEGKALHTIGIGYCILGNFEKAMEYYYQGLEVHKSIGNKRGIASVNISIGNVFWHYSDYEKAMEKYNQVLKLYEEAINKENTAKILNNRANIYIQWGKLDKALEDYTRSLKIKEEIGFQPGIALTLDNMGLVYRELGSYEKALEFHERALKIYKETNHKVGIARSLNNLGLVYKERKDYQHALECYRQSLQIKDEIGNKSGIAVTLENVGEIYLHSKNYPKALEFQNKSLEIRKQLGDKFGIAKTLSIIGRIYKEMDQFTSALEYLNQSLEIAQPSHVRDIIKDSYLAISEIFYARGDSDKSLQYYKKYTEIKEEIFNKDAINRIREIQLKYEKDKIETRARKSRYKTLAIFWGVVFLLVLAMGLLAYNRYRLKNKTNELLEEKEMEIETHRTRLQVLNEQLKEFLLLKKRKKYEKSALTPEQAEKYHKNLIAFMDEKKPYLEFELTVNMLAEQLHISPRDLSQVINERTNKNFCDFINHYRIEEAKRLLAQTHGKKEISILDIAFDVGFNSKSSFNTVFKKYTGLTPSDFQKRRKHPGLLE